MIQINNTFVKNFKMKIASKLFAIVLCIVVSSCYQAERNCSDFKKGNFKSEFEFEGVKQSSTFFRNDTLEISHFNNTVDSAEVRWINDCEYVVKKLNPKNRFEKQAVHMKILTTTKNGYTFEFSIVGNPNTKRGTVTKLN